MENQIKVIDHRGRDESMPVPTATDPNAVIIMAMQKGYTPELVEKMMALQERNDANEARKAYFEAVAAFKAEAPRVKKDKYNNFFKSHYTSLGNLLDTYNPVLGKYGLSISLPPQSQDDKKLTIEGRLSHRLGHTESITMTGPIDQAAVGRASGERSRNPIQDIRSTFTYLRAMVVEALLGVAGTEGTVDDDGNGAGSVVEYVSPGQLSTIVDTVNEKGVDEEKFLSYMKAESTETILAKDYNKAIAALKKAKGRQPGEEG